MSDLRALRNYINGECVPAVEGRTLQIIDPALGAAYATAPLSGSADVDAAMAAAAAAFPGWRGSTPAAARRDHRRYSAARGAQRGVR